MAGIRKSSLRSFLEVPADSHFPIQNLPFGVFRPEPTAEARAGVAIGDWVLDLAALERGGLLNVPTLAVQVEIFARPCLNAFMALGRTAVREVRDRITRLLSHDESLLRDDAALRREVLVPRSGIEMLLPVQIGDYTDFYSSKEHATNVGSMLRGPENALNPNWVHIPIAYHGRASSIVVSGTEIRRPVGQTKSDSSPSPTFGPSRTLDFELEMGVFIGRGNALGEPIAVEQTPEHMFGIVLVNDWSARDIQKWEYQPLGPFLSKSFATTISPWIVTLDAMEPFRVPGPTHDPLPLEYLRSHGDWALDIELEVLLQTPQQIAPQTICRSNHRHLYWNICQQTTHHTSNGCNLRPGDLLASGTISGPGPGARGSLLELTMGGREPLLLPGGEQRRFLEDGDRLTLTAWCQGDGYRVGFGEATGVILPAYPAGDSGK